MKLGLCGAGVFHVWKGPYIQRPSCGHAVSVSGFLMHIECKKTTPGPFRSSATQGPAGPQQAAKAPEKAAVSITAGSRGLGNLKMRRFDFFFN